MPVLPYPPTRVCSTKVKKRSSRVRDTSSEAGQSKECVDSHAFCVTEAVVVAYPCNMRPLPILLSDELDGNHTRDGDTHQNKHETVGSPGSRGNPLYRHPHPTLIGPDQK